MKQLLHIKKGFTLIELLVVLVIMSLITLVFLTRQTKFDSSTLMRAVAYSVALSARQAQVYGISVRSTTPGSAQFTAAHGLHFDQASPNSYFIFADQNNNNKYEGTDSIDKSFVLGNSFTVSTFCVVYYSGASQVRHCSNAADSSDGVTIKYLDVLFIRPNPDANIYGYNASYLPIVGDLAYSYAYVRISSRDSSTRGIHIWNTGQISVDLLSDPI